jgi:hypothetical protein
LESLYRYNVQTARQHQSGVYLTRQIDNGTNFLAGIHWLDDSLECLKYDFKYLSLILLYQWTLTIAVRGLLLVEKGLCFNSNQWQSYVVNFTVDSTISHEYGLSMIHTANLIPTIRQDFTVCGPVLCHKYKKIKYSSIVPLLWSCREDQD